MSPEGGIMTFSTMSNTDITKCGFGNYRTIQSFNNPFTSHSEGKTMPIDENSNPTASLHSVERTLTEGYLFKSKRTASRDYGSSPSKKITSVY